MKVLSLDSYIIETLMPDLVGHDRHPAAFLVYLYLWRQAHGIEGGVVRRSLREISEGTGISKRAVQMALKRLGKRRLIGVTRESMTAIPVYRVLAPWKPAGARQVSR